VRESLRRQRYAFDLREWRGLGLTPIVVVPHVDNPDFGECCRQAGICAQPMATCPARGRCPGAGDRRGTSRPGLRPRWLDVDGEATLKGPCRVGRSQDSRPLPVMTYPSPDGRAQGVAVQAMEVDCIW